jgi:hypothetical protein
MRGGNPGTLAYKKALREATPLSHLAGRHFRIGSAVYTRGSRSLSPEETSSTSTPTSYSPVPGGQEAPSEFCTARYSATPGIELLTWPRPLAHPTKATERRMQTMFILRRMFPSQRHRRPPCALMWSQRPTARLGHETFSYHHPQSCSAWSVCHCGSESLSHFFHLS